MNIKIGIYPKNPRTVYVPTPWDLAQPIILDGNTLWYDWQTGTVLSGGRVQAWDERLSPGASTRLGNIYGAGLYPLLAADGIQFVTARNDLLQKTFALVQPTMIYMVVRVDSYVANSCLFDGNTANSCKTTMGNTANRINVRTGGTWSGFIDGLVAGTWQIIRVLLNGANSKIQIDALGYFNQALEAGNMDGLAVGIDAATNNPSSITVKDIMIRKVVDSLADDTILYNYLKYKNGL